MGPLVYGWRSKRSGTLYSLRAFPIGGYCAMHGEDNKTSEAEKQREFRQTVTINGREYDDDNFQAKSPLQRLAIVFAGPIANFILTLAILFVSAVLFGVQSDNVQPRVGPLSPGMPAQRAGLHAGDKILSVNGQDIHNGNQLVGVIHRSLHKPLKLTYLHDGTTGTLTVTPTRRTGLTRPDSRLAASASRSAWSHAGTCPVSPVASRPSSAVRLVGRLHPGQVTFAFGEVALPEEVERIRERLRNFEGIEEVEPPQMLKDVLLKKKIIAFVERNPKCPPLKKAIVIPGVLNFPTIQILSACRLCVHMPIS